MCSCARARNGGKLPGMKGSSRFFLSLAILFLGTAPKARCAETPGSVDLSFDVGVLGGIQFYNPGFGTVIGLALGQNDEIYIGGHFTDFVQPEPLQGKDWNGLARLNGDGTLDESFAVPVFDQSSPLPGHIDAHKIFVQDDGTVWAGYSLFSWRFRSDGGIYPVSTNQQFRSIVKVYPDGRFLEGGSWTVRRCLPDGSTDTSFSQFTGEQEARIILRDGRVLNAARSERFAGTIASGFLNRLNENGTVDSSYLRPNFTTNGIEGLGLFLERPNGQVYVAGEFTEVNGKPFSRLIRLNEDGTLDENFRPDARLTGTNAPKVLAMALQPNGKLLLGGDFSKSEAPIAAGIVRLNTDGSIDTSFDPGTGVSEGHDTEQFPWFQAKVVNIEVQNDGKILVAGDFRKFNGIARDGIVRLQGDPVEPLRIVGISRSNEGRITLDFTGTFEVVEVQESAELDGEWRAVAVKEAGGENSVRIEVGDTGGAETARFFKIRRR